MRFFICSVAFLAAALYADNFIDPNVWTTSEDNVIVVDQDLPPITMPKTPLPSIEPIFPEEIDVQNTQSAAPIVKKPIVTNVRPEPIADEFWVQMGAFADAQGAAKLENSLIASGYAAKTFGGDLNRVAVGPYASRRQAEESLYNLREIEAAAFLTTANRLR
ncbi:MAG: SPOR domain-containing protein [Helicobacteraceae bacterium]|nr:SPOR domain-containing protein [Helicobacteraceae bacterium]